MEVGYIGVTDMLRATLVVAFTLWSLDPVPVSGFLSPPQSWRKHGQFDTTVQGSGHRVGNFHTGGAGGLRAELCVTRVESVCEGCVVVASPNDYGHFTAEAVGLVYEHGAGTTKAVCLDRGTPFTIGEMANADFGPLTGNRLYRGGEDGQTVAVMIHPHFIAGAKPIGYTGLFVGGLSAALEAVKLGRLPTEDFKFFFNYMSWPEGGLEEQVKKGKWQLVSIPNEIILNQQSVGDMELCEVAVMIPLLQKIHRSDLHTMLGKAIDGKIYLIYCKVTRQELTY
ncbi:unnamed protein product [Choristocarpus tenellus]